MMHQNMKKFIAIGAVLLNSQSVAEGLNLLRRGNQLQNIEQETGASPVEEEKELSADEMKAELSRSIDEKVTEGYTQMDNAKKALSVLSGKLKVLKKQLAEPVLQTGIALRYWGQKEDVLNMLAGQIAKDLGEILSQTSLRVFCGYAEDLGAKQRGLKEELNEILASGSENVPDDGGIPLLEWKNGVEKELKGKQDELKNLIEKVQEQVKRDSEELEKRLDVSKELGSEILKINKFFVQAQKDFEGKTVQTVKKVLDTIDIREGAGKNKSFEEKLISVKEKLNTIKKVREELDSVSPTQLIPLSASAYITKQVGKTRESMAELTDKKGIAEGQISQFKKFVKEQHECMGKIKEKSKFLSAFDTILSERLKELEKSLRYDELIFPAQEKALNEGRQLEAELMTILVESPQNIDEEVRSKVKMVQDGIENAKRKTENFSSNSNADWVAGRDLMKGYTKELKNLASGSELVKDNQKLQNFKFWDNFHTLFQTTPQFMDVLLVYGPGTGPAQYNIENLLPFVTRMKQVRKTMEETVRETVTLETDVENQLIAVDALKTAVHSIWNGSAPSLINGSFFNKKRSFEQIMDSKKQIKEEIQHLADEALTTGGLTEKAGKRNNFEER